MPCNCAVVVREVWDTRDLVGDILDDSGKLKESVLQTRFEPEDLNALEAALRIKDRDAGTVTAISIGDSRNVDVLREGLYRGVDKVIRIAGHPHDMDVQGMADMVADAARGITDCKLLLVGTTVVDGENSLMGAHIASALGVDQVSWVDEIESASESTAVGKRAVEMGYESVEVPLPAVMSIGVALLEDDPRAPRSAKAMLKLKMKKVAIDPVSPETAPVVTTPCAGFEKVEQRVIESTIVDGEDEEALKAMLDEALKGAL